MTLITDTNFGDNFEGDDIYQQLLEAHQGLSNEQSHALNARLVLILMNHIGDKEILKQAINKATIKESENHE